MVKKAYLLQLLNPQWYRLLVSTFIIIKFLFKKQLYVDPESYSFRSIHNLKFWFKQWQSLWLKRPTVVDPKLHEKKYKIVQKVHSNISSSLRLNVSYVNLNFSQVLFSLFHMTRKSILLTRLFMNSTHTQRKLDCFFLQATHRMNKS